MLALTGLKIPISLQPFQVMAQAKYLKYRGNVGIIDWICPQSSYVKAQCDGIWR